MKALAYHSIQGAQTEFFYNGDLEGDLIATWMADVEAAAARRKLTKEQEYILSQVHLLRELDA